MTNLGPDYPNECPCRVPNKSNRSPSVGEGPLPRQDVRPAGSKILVRYSGEPINHQDSDGLDNWAVFGAGGNQGILARVSLGNWVFRRRFDLLARSRHLLLNYPDLRKIRIARSLSDTTLPIKLHSSHSVFVLTKPISCQLSFLLTLLLLTSPCSCTIRHYMFIIYDFVFVLAGGVRELRALP